MKLNRIKSRSYTLHLNLGLLILAILTSSITVSAQVVNGRVSDSLLYPESVSFNDFIGDRLEASYRNRVLAQDVDKLIEPFKSHTETRCWQTEFWGKWFTSAVLAYRYQPEPELKNVLDRAVSELIATQTPSGYIGNYAEENLLEQWDIWGRKYSMLGLLDYHKLTGDKKSLNAAKKLADNLMSDINKEDGIIVTKGNYRGMAASSVLEPICHLYNYTKEKKYLQFAEEIVRQWETQDGPQLISKANVNVAERFPRPASWYSWEQGQKAYEMMSCYEGLLELYRITGKEEYKKAVVDTWENIKNTEINVAGSGAAVEMWFGGKDFQSNPIYHYQETCVTVTWLKLSHQLLRLTGEAKYADAVERTFYNALLGSMSADGANWAKYTPLNGQRLPGSEQCGMGLNCCEASGPRGLFNVPFHTVMGHKNGFYLNYFIDGNYELSSPSGQQVTLTQKTSYPISGKIHIEVKLAKEEEMAIHVRIPTWSKLTAIVVNGEKMEAPVPGEYAQLKRQWKTGDRIDLELDMRGTIEKSGISPQYVAIMRGPIVLARDARLGGPDLGVTSTPITDENGFVALEESVQQDRNIWMQYTAKFQPESYQEAAADPIDITLCDYASAGYDHDLPLFNVWLPQLVDPRNLGK